ncbi:MAG: SPW repeat protein [Parcubacteria group bacterium]
MTAKTFNWVILVFGIWVILSPILLGSVGTILFYSNTVIGALLVVFAVKNIMGGKSIKI